MYNRAKFLSSAFIIMVIAVPSFAAFGETPQFIDKKLKILLPPTDNQTQPTQDADLGTCDFKSSNEECIRFVETQTNPIIYQYQANRRDTCISEKITISCKDYKKEELTYFGMITSPRHEVTLEKSNNIFKKAGDGISNAWNSTKDAITGIFRGAEPCDDAASKKLIGNPDVTHITKTKLDTKQTEFSEGQDSGAGKCVVAGCAKNYIPNDDRTGCVQSEGPCTPTAENATAGELKNGTCIITECANEYHPSDDGTSCEHAELSEEDSKAKVDALRDNAQKMKDKEQSTPNKLLGTAAIAATGIGGMNLMSGLAEQNADDDAEQDMKAYLATFTCDFGQGRNIKGGEREIELPGTTNLLPLYTEYKALAADLKERKTALNMPSGIESEVIFDKAETGLYDDVGTGITSGAYTSVARALQDPTGEDAQAWTQQKQAAHDKVKTALTTVGIATAGAIAGDLALNSRNKNQSDKIINDYEKKKRVFAVIQQRINEVPETPKSCPDGSTGTWDQCDCNDPNSYFHSESGCVKCEGGKQLNNDHSGCECPTNMTENPTTGQCEQLPPTCTLTGLVTSDCKCIEHAAEIGNHCTCTAPYVEMNSLCVCPPETHEYHEETGECTERQKQAQEPITLKFNANSYFANGKAKLTDKAVNMLERIGTEIAAEAQNQNIEKADLKEYNVCITGQTDPNDFRKGSPKNNKDLSAARAYAITHAISDLPTLFKDIKYRGTGKVTTKDEQTSGGTCNKNDPGAYQYCICDPDDRSTFEFCRRVVLTLQAEECGTGFIDGEIEPANYNLYQ